MSKVIIPISVELGNSLQQIKQVNKEFEKLADTASQPLQSALPDAPVKSIKQQLREANVELQNAVANFGKLSPQAQEAAKKVADLKDVIEDSAKAAAAGDFEDRFQLAGKAIAGVAGAFQTVTAVQAIFGEQSKATEEALKKVQAAMALTQGISAVLEGKKAFEALGASAKKALKGIQSGIAATGIGLLIIAVGLLVAYWDDIKEAITGVSAAQKKLLEDQNKSVISAAKQVEIIKDTEDSLRAQGKSEREILKTKKEAVLDELNKRKAVIETNIKLREQRVEATKASQESLTSILKVFNFAIDGVFVLIDTVAIGLNKVGVLSNETLAKVLGSREKFSKFTANLFFDPDKEKKAADEATEADRKAIRTLQNEYDSYQNQIKKLDADAVKDKQDKAKERAKLEEEANKILLEITRKGASKSQQEIFKIQDEYIQKRKQLAEAGIKDFTALNQAEANDILKVQQASNQEVLKARQDFENSLGKIFLDAVKKRKELQNQADADIKSSRELSQRAELSAIKDDEQKKRQELRNAENKEMQELEKAYEDKKISLEKFLQDQAAIEAFYTNQRAGIKTKEQEDELKRLQDFQSTISDSIAEAADAFGTALAEGADPFQAVFKSLANSLGGYLQQLGKDAIKTSILIQSIKKAIGTPSGIVAGIALVALGAAIKAAFNRKTEKGFARGGYIYGPGTETSDSIPARLSKGEYVVNAKSVRRYGARTMDKINAGQVPVASLIMATERSTGRNGGSATALVNRFAGIEMFSEGGLVESFRQFGRNGGSATALVNRFEVPIPYTQGDPWRALINRSEVPNIGGDNFQRGQPYIVTTKISGQDLKLVLERADRRFSNAT